MFASADGTAEPPAPTGSDELVGWHGAQFGSAWEPTSGAVAKKAAMAMIPVISFGLDDPLADGTGVANNSPTRCARTWRYGRTSPRRPQSVADSWNPTTAAPCS
ncbi:hypothetical protein [Streptomyces formicae]